jgi:hypothetical protein
MKALMNFIVGDDVRLALVAVAAVVFMWAFHDIPMMWVLFPAVLTTALIVAVLHRPRL